MIKNRSEKFKLTLVRSENKIYLHLNRHFLCWAQFISNLATHCFSYFKGHYFTCVRQADKTTYRSSGY